MENVMITDWIQMICAIPAAVGAMICAIVGIKSLPKIRKKIETISNDVSYEKNITNPEGCMFLELGKVEPEKGHRTRHEYCNNPRMRETNKVQPDEKLSCMGSRCGCAVFQATQG